jgi:cytochrome c oxidase cbb3-type subunit 3
MSDFVHSGWAIFVAAITIIGLVACLWLLIVASKRQVMADDNTTGHVWDVDLRELNNPLPRWWMILFVLTVVFAAAYLALYPGLGSAAGVLGWTSTGQLKTEQDRAGAAMAPLYAGLASATPEQLVANPQAMAIGERLFLNNCAACHGSDGRGSKGFPNLADADWLYGGSHEKIVETITAGRQGVMPPMGAALGTPDDVRNVAHYVLSLSGTTHDAAKAAAGQAKFAVCAACHGPDGKGNPALGAPNLTDKVWLHGFGEEAIVAMINEGKTNVMPAQASRFTPDQIRVLGAYVMGLGQRTVAAK